MIRIVSILTLFTAFNLAAQSSFPAFTSFDCANQPKEKDDFGITTSYNRSQKTLASGEGFRVCSALAEVRQKDSTKKHSPKLASIYSAVLPGLGQAYNRKYWKIPIVLAGLGATGYFIKYNRTEMRKFQNALIVRLDNDSTTNVVGDLANVSNDILTSERNRFRTYRDYNIIAFAAVYLLNIVDASVDAHFYKFNIDKPLAQQKKRHLYFASNKVLGKPTLGLAYRW